MALPTNDLDWVHWLTRRHDAELPSLELLDRYYEGTQPLAYMQPEVQREVGDRIKPVIIDWPRLVIDAVEERLDVEGFRLAGKDSADSDLWRVWQANDLDETSQLGHVDALVMRRSYVCVGSNEDDPATPLVTAESPLEMYADIDPRTRKVRAALRRVDECDGLSTEQNRYATLYLPDATVWFEWAGGWQVIDRDDHKLGVVPVVPLVNRRRLRSVRRRSDGFAIQYGTSELASVLPLSDAANKLATDMMVAAEFHALPLRAMFGVGPDDFVDRDGNQLTAMQVVMGKLAAIPTESAADVKPYEFSASSLTNFHDSINQLAQLVASIAGLPPHYLGYATDNPASADAIRSAESRLVKRAERKQRAFGGGWEQVMRLVRRIQDGGKDDPSLAQLETVWRDASTPTVAESADAASKLYVAGIVPLRTTREKIGFSQEEIARMEDEDQAAAERDPLTAAAKIIGQGNPADAMVGAGGSPSAGG